MQYFPNAPVSKALHSLCRGINLTQGRLYALEQTGYNKRQKILTPRQAALIGEYHGEP